jgi:hypothetical protein
MPSLIRRSTIAAVAGVAALVALPLTPALSVLAASNPQPVLASSSISQRSAGGLAADPTTTTCKPDKNGDHFNNDNDKNKCPPPVVPEAPSAALLPLSAGVMIGGTYLMMRLRGRNQASA